MSTVSIYLNFMGQTEEAFNVYKSLFGGAFEGEGIMYLRDVPPMPGQPELPENEKNSVMHVSLPILGGIRIMGTDMLESMGHQLKIGNNTTINLEPDSKEEVDRMYAALSEGGTDCMAPSDQFWGAYWGVCLDRFGIRWMFNYTYPQA